MKLNSQPKPFRYTIRVDGVTTYVVTADETFTETLEKGEIIERVELSPEEADRQLFD